MFRLSGGALSPTDAMKKNNGGGGGSRTRYSNLTI